LPLSPESSVVGESSVIIAKHEDTFVRLAREYDLGFLELAHANPGVNPWLPGEGTELVIPTRFVLPDAPRSGIVINLPELRLYYYPEDNGDRVITHPISIGRMEWRTPLGLTEVVRRAENPTWYPPQSVRDEHAAQGRPLDSIVPPGPDNPLGNHALYLGLPGYLIHGTNMPFGLGMRVTHGCIRMFPEDIESLFNSVPIGTQVRIVNQPFKLGRSDSGYFLEAHPLLDEELQGDEVSIMTELTRAYVAATEEEGQGNRFDWETAERIVMNSRGVPEFIAFN
ncbi:MAG TPA: L,D-transpeptidase family protein, partial [Gammaproteobacteria bacterium]